MSAVHYIIASCVNTNSAEMWSDGLYSPDTTCQMAIRRQVDTEQLIW